MGYTIILVIICVVVFYIIDDIFKSIKVMSLKEKLVILALLLMFLLF